MQLPIISAWLYWSGQCISYDARGVEDGPGLASGGGVTSGVDVALYSVEHEL
jgi:hypothetical protein